MLEWRPVYGYEGLYSVSNEGNVYSNVRKKILNPIVSGEHSRIVVNLYKQGERKQKRVHRLVAEAFIENPEDYPNVLHWDDDPTNNHVSNLRWGTDLHNTYDSIRNGSHHNARKTHCIRGHELNGDNVHVWRDKRICRKCWNYRR